MYEEEKRKHPLYIEKRQNRPAEIGIIPFFYKKFECILNIKDKGNQ